MQKQTIKTVLFTGGIIVLCAVVVPRIMDAVAHAGVNPLSSRGKDIYVAIVNANTEREPLGFGSIWPKAGERNEAGEDITQMTFENSSDYFTVLIDGERMDTPEWSPYAHGLDWSRFAGNGVRPKKRRGRLTAANNAWIIAANVTDEMPDILPILISRNVDPDSLIPQEGDLRQQFLRPSKTFTTPFGDQGFVMIRKGGASMFTRFCDLHTFYVGQDGEEFRASFQKIKYLSP